MSDDPQIITPEYLIRPAAAETNGGSTAYEVASWITTFGPPVSGVQIVPSGQVAGHWLYGSVVLTIGDDLPPDLEPVGWDAICPPIPTGGAGEVAYVWTRIATGDANDALALDWGPLAYLVDGRVAEWAGVKIIQPWPVDENNSFVLSFPGMASVWFGVLQFAPQPARAVVALTFDEIRTVGLIAPDGLPPSGSQMVAMAQGAVGWYADGYPGEPAMEVRTLEVFRCPTRDGVRTHPPRMTSPGWGFR